MVHRMQLTSQLLQIDVAQSLLAKIELQHRDNTSAVKPRSGRDSRRAVVDRLKLKVTWQGARKWSAISLSGAAGNDVRTSCPTECIAADISQRPAEPQEKTELYLPIDVSL